jgi:hypothetical protein
MFLYPARRCCPREIDQDRVVYPSKADQGWEHSSNIFCSNDGVRFLGRGSSSRFMLCIWNMCPLFSIMIKLSESARVVSISESRDVVEHAVYGYQK